MTSEVYVPRGYVSLEKQEYAVPARPYGYKPHRRHHHGGSGICGCLSCCCCVCSCCRCCICIILIIIILLVGIGLALYYLIKPIVPSYDFEQIDIKSFDMRNDDMLYTDVMVVVKAENPNEDIGIDYLEDNKVRIMYSGAQLCSGQIPPFLQPGKNITMINVELKGETEFGAQMQNRFMEDQKLGKIPLLVTVTLPVRFVIKDLIHLKKVVANVNCSLIIDKLEPNKKPKILDKDFTYGIEF